MIVLEMNDRMNSDPGDRRTEWFVPKFGSPRFRLVMGLLFPPYTGMVLSFSVIGSMLAPHFFYDRVLAITVIYLLGLGGAAHALDAIGSKGVKPWGTLFTPRQLWLMAGVCLVLAYLIAIYYMIRYVPLLAVVAVCEGFFVFSYNLEWFEGTFHTDRWFAFSWGFLPVLAGYIIQTNKISLEALVLAVSMAFFSIIEIKASRPYRDLKRRFATLTDEEASSMMRYEAILKSVSFGVILLGGGLLIWRLAH